MYQKIPPTLTQSCHYFSKANDSDEYVAGAPPCSFHGMACKGRHAKGIAPGHPTISAANRNTFFTGDPVGTGTIRYTKAAIAGDIVACVARIGLLRWNSSPQDAPSALGGPSMPTST